MININSLIGLKFKFQGTNEYTDCVNLAKRFYELHGWPQNFSDGKEITEEKYKHQPLRILRYLMKEFFLVQDFTYGDIVVFNIGGDFHLGIYVGYGKLLSMIIPTDESSKSCILRGPSWLPYTKYTFRRKE